MVVVSTSLSGGSSVTGGPAFRPDGVDGYLNDPAQLIDADGTVEHPYSSSAFLNNFNGGNNVLLNTYAGTRYDWRAYESVENFFRSGGVSNTSVNIRGASDDGSVSYNVNYGNLDEEGFMPGNGLKRNNLSVGGRAKLSNNFTVQGSMNYSNTSFVSPPVAASAGNGTLGWSTFGNLFFTPRNVDLMGLPFEIPENSGSIYYRNGNDIINPRWSVKNAQGGQTVNRINATTSLTYDFDDNLSLTYRYGLDWYNERNKDYSNKNGVYWDDAIYGYLRTWDNNVQIHNHYMSLNGSFDLSDDVGLTFNVGATSKYIFGSPMFLAISANLALISSDGKYGSNTPFAKLLKVFGLNCLSLNSALNFVESTPSIFAALIFLFISC